MFYTGFTADSARFSAKIVHAPIANPLRWIGRQLHRMGPLPIILFSMHAASAASADIATPPDWVVKPSIEEIQSAYPALPRMLGIEGFVRLDCDATTVGILENCKVGEVSPAGFGFGEAALSATPSFRFRPQVRDGEPSRGQVKIPITFALRDTSPLAPVGPPTSPAALALARDYVSAIGTREGIRRLYALRGQLIQTVPAPGITMELRSAAARALQTAAEDHTAAMIERRASRYAAMFTEQELAGLLDAARSSPQPLLLESRRDVSRLDAKLTREFRRRLQVASTTIFCRSQNCEPVADLRTPEKTAELFKATIPRPIWLEQPTLEQISDARPPLAWRFGLDGRIWLVCEVERLGFLEACKIHSETPSGLGFGAAAQSLARYFRLSLTQGAGDTLDTVAVQVQFRATRTAGTPAVLAPPKSDRGLQLAREYMAATFDLPWRRALADQEMRDLEARSLNNVAQEVKTKAIAAIRQSGEETWADMQEYAARAYASEFDEKDLARSVAFLKTKEGRALVKHRRSLDQQVGGDVQVYGDIVSTEAGLILCRSQGCSVSLAQTGVQPPPPAPQPTPANPAPSTRNP
jgi:TonB family protein